MVRRFRKKPTVIEAVRFYSLANLDECLAFIGAPRDKGEDVDDFEDGFDVETLHGPVWVSLGDWIIRGEGGDYWPCKPDVFDATYEGPVE